MQLLLLWKTGHVITNADAVVMETGWLPCVWHLSPCSPTPCTLQSRVSRGTNAMRAWTRVYQSEWVLLLSLPINKLINKYDVMIDVWRHVVICTCSVGRPTLDSNSTVWQWQTSLSTLPWRSSTTILAGDWHHVNHTPTHDYVTANQAYWLASITFLCRLIVQRSVLLMSILGLPEFDLPGELLNIVYTQGLFWFVTITNYYFSYAI